MYGSFRRPWWHRLRNRAPFKVDLLACHLKKINPRLSVRAFPQNVVLETAARELMDRDIIFLCTDDHWGRSIVNQVAHQYLIPTINLGVRIAAQDGTISAAVGIVDLLRPDLPLPGEHERQAHGPSAGGVQGQAGSRRSRQGEHRSQEVVVT